MLVYLLEIGVIMKNNYFSLELRWLLFLTMSFDWKVGAHKLFASYRKVQHCVDLFRAHHFVLWLFLHEYWNLNNFIFPKKSIFFFCKKRIQGFSCSYIILMYINTSPLYFFFVINSFLSNQDLFMFFLSNFFPKKK
jgi:hypothetical protein